MLSTGEIILNVVIAVGIVAVVLVVAHLIRRRHGQDWYDVDVDTSAGGGVDTTYGIDIGDFGGGGDGGGDGGGGGE